MVGMMGHGMGCECDDVDGSRHGLGWLAASLMFCGMKRKREKEIEMIINKK